MSRASSGREALLSAPLASVAPIFAILTRRHPLHVLQIQSAQQSCPPKPLSSRFGGGAAIASLRSLVHGQREIKGQ